jgi:hypothetical protein
MTLSPAKSPPSSFHDHTVWYRVGPCDTTSATLLMWVYYRTKTADVKTIHRRNVAPVPPLMTSGGKKVCEQMRYIGARYHNPTEMLPLRGFGSQITDRRPIVCALANISQSVDLVRVPSIETQVP